MTKISCFSFLLGGGGNKKKSKVWSKVACAKRATGNDCPKVKPLEFMDMVDAVDVISGVGNAPARDTSVVVLAAAESARQERDGKEDKASVKRGASDASIVAGEDSTTCESDDAGKNGVGGGAESDAAGDSSPSDGRMSSPTASPRLQRSCSNIETARRCVPKEFVDLPAKSRSYGDLKTLRSGRLLLTTSSGGGAPDASPTAASVRTSCSADRVMLKKRSSRQVLPSRSRKLWWRLLLWSHRNMHRPGASATTPFLPPSADTYNAPRQNDGYTSDTLDVVTAATREPKNKEVAAEEEEEEPIPNQWVAFSAEASSSLDRVSAWVNSLGNGSFHAVDEEEEEEDDVAEHDPAARAPCSEIVECSALAAEKHARGKRRAADEAVQASSVVQTLNMVSSVAHISGMGLKAVPMIAAFSTLRAVNLSGNFIVHISPGSLPKGLHSLDLSRNNIANIEGLRELTRLRVLNLSYNRISRIGHGLSSCTAIRELYLAGNKISDVEGLHRLLKLAVLDVSFNKITTAKSLGQLVANYGSLRALNLVGNPVQANVGDETLRKAVSGLLPRLEYLNKQAVKPQRAREVAKDSVAQAALGNGGWGAARSSRRVARRVMSQSPGSSSVRSRGRDGGGSSRRGSRSRSKTRAQGSSLSRK
ncbi:hypothetical protein EJB05_07737 [Eragrostis curvula]|uniref:U2A'/phosphoprotein 32 family A C-terminal domain-containing protein n=1 Tax=Eragrostis curvula TaxID=38414 RepID=A0A5J9WHD2_9POAL|nr:hypothetical protein EJB05_07737 [Eragrostis curvula]